MNMKTIDNDEDTLIENILYLMNNFIELDPLIVSNEDFEEYLYNNINELFLIIVEDFNKITSFQSIRKNFNYWYSYCKTIFYQTIIPRRYYKNTFIRLTPNIEKIKNKIDILRNKYQPDQRTNEWYEYRYNLITASNAWKCFGNDRIRNQIIYEKCKPLTIHNEYNVNVNSSLHHGQKYEDLSVMIYEKKYNTKIEDFGCIKHDKYSFLGASPDGINIEPESPLYGRMLEIKNPTSREIKGIPKEEYWIQTQLQMEVCDLNECDFLETKFVEYDNEYEFKNEGGFDLKNKEFDVNNLKGVMLHFSINNKNKYIYAPLLISEEEFNIWFEKIQNDYMNKEETDNNIYIRTIYWKLEKYSCVLILRNKLWFEEAIKYINKIWNIVEKERIEGYEHRQPQKRTKSIDINKDNPIPTFQEFCGDKVLIDISLNVQSKYSLTDIEKNFDIDNLQIDISFDIVDC